MTIALCDDNTNVLDFLENKIMNNFGKRFTLIRYENAHDLYRDCENLNPKADIIIMDILFADENGVHIARKIQELYSDMKIIFITGYPELASQIFRAAPTFLLIKPISSELLCEAVATAEKQLQEDIDKAICIPYDGTFLRIKPSSIYYIELKDRCVTLYWTGGSYVTKYTIDEWEAMLPSESFNRIHKSFLVNMDYIMEYNYTKLMLTTNIILPISRKKAKTAKKKFLDYINHH